MNKKARKFKKYGGRKVYEMQNWVGEAVFREILDESPELKNNRAFIGWYKIFRESQDTDERVPIPDPSLMPKPKSEQKEIKKRRVVDE